MHISASRESFREILRRHPRRFKRHAVLRHLITDAVLWGGILGLKITWHWPAATCAILFAVFSFRSFGLMHECVHSAASPSTRVNKSLGFWAGVFCFLPFAGWREMHIVHHRWTGNVEKDPTTKILLAFEKADFKMPRLLVGTWRLWFPLLGFMQHVVFWKATVTKGEFRFVLCCGLYLGILTLVLGPGTLALGLLAYLYLVETINLPHHLGMAQHRGDTRFALHEQNQFTRSCVYPRWFSHGVLLNFNLHTAHHLFPSHPWYQLDQLHEEVVAQGLQVNTCNGNEWILKNRARHLDEVLAESFPRAKNEKRAA